MKKIMAIIGSPRKGGNTEILTDHMIKGCESRGAVEVEKVFVIDKKITFCNGCLTCVEQNAKGCVIKDDMEGILERMVTCDGLIFATPNHMRTVTAPMLNFMSRMLPLLKLKVEQDSGGNVTGGAFDSQLRGKKAAIIISQGDPTISSFLVFTLLERNFIDFQLLRVGEIISLGNVSKGEVNDKENDLQAAFSLGTILTS
jgi:multimeric flavodoxin WrbA